MLLIVIMIINFNGLNVDGEWGGGGGGGGSSRFDKYT